MSIELAVQLEQVCVLVAFSSDSCVLNPGRDGMAITLVTQYDIQRLHNVESHIS